LEADEIVRQYKNFNINAFSVWLGDDEVPSQTGDTDADGVADEVIFLASFAGLEQTRYVIRYNPHGVVQHDYPKRTQAEIGVRVGAQLIDDAYTGGHFETRMVVDVPPNHSIGDGLYKYEGAGWESDKIAYRIYLDERFAIDIFGKKVTRNILQDVGHEQGAYHEPAPWGMDILKVGQSLGVGALGMLQDSKVHRVEKTDGIHATIMESGAVRSRLRIHHNNWIVGDGGCDLTSDLSIHAGSRLTHYEVNITGNPPNLVTGIVKHPPVEVLLSGPGGGPWKYIATHGNQSLAGDKLGTAVFFKQQDLFELSEDENNYLVRLKPGNGHLDYFFLGAWAQEPNGINTAEDFKTYLQRTARKLNAPIRITY